MRVRLGRDEGEVVAVLREADAAVPLPGALDAPTAAWWAAHGLPDLVAALVLRPDPTPTYKAAALPLLYTLLAGVVDDLRHARLPLTAACTAFTRALSHTAPFYTRSKDDVTPEFKTRLVREGESERLFARLPRSGRLRECSLLLIGTINYFGDIGGFEALADVIETPTVTVQDMLIALRPVHALRSLFTERFLRLYVGRVRVPIFRALASVAHGDVTSETLAQCSELRASFVRLLARVSLPDAARAACDLDIEVAARLLQGDSLQRRLNGLQRLREVISRVASPSHVAVEEASLGAKIGALFGAEQKEDGEKALDDEHGGRADAEVVYEALCRHDVLDRVLAIAHTHVEILGQSVETLKFYARMGKLVAAHVEQLWDKRAALHEHDRRTFDHALAALMPSIPRELLERLLHRIAATDLRHFDAPLLDLVVTATELVARVPEAGVADVGLHILWSAVTAPVPLAVSKRATSLLGELLRAPALAPKRERLLDQCLDALTDERVLRLLRRLLEVLPPKALTQFLAHAEAEKALVQHLVDSLSDFQRQISKALKRARKAGTSPDGMRATLDALPLSRGDSYAAQIEARLDFLAFVLHGCPSLQLSADRLEQLWDALVTAAADAEGVDQFLVWLSDQRLDAHCRDVAFERLCRVLPQRFPASGLPLFYRLWIARNESVGAIKRLRAGHEPSCFVVSGNSELVYAPALFAVALRDGTVAQQAADFLASLFARTAKLSSRAKAQRVRDMLFELVLRYCRDHPLCVTRGVDVLDVFLDKCKSVTDAAECDADQADTGSALEVSIKSSHQQMRKGIFKATALIGMVAERARSAFELGDTPLTVLHGDRVLPAHATLGECDVRDGSVLTVRRRTLEDAPVPHRLLRDALPLLFAGLGLSKRSVPGVAEGNIAARPGGHGLFVRVQAIWRNDRASPTGESPTELNEERHENLRGLLDLEALQPSALQSLVRLLVRLGPSTNHVAKLRGLEPATWLAQHHALAPTDAYDLAVVRTHLLATDDVRQAWCACVGALCALVEPTLGTCLTAASAFSTLSLLELLNALFAGLSPEATAPRALVGVLQAVLSACAGAPEELADDAEALAAATFAVLTSMVKDDDTRAALAAHASFSAWLLDLLYARVAAIRPATTRFFSGIILDAQAAHSSPLLAALGSALASSTSLSHARKAGAGEAGSYFALLNAFVRACGVAHLERGLHKAVRKHLFSIVAGSTPGSDDALLQGALTLLATLARSASLPRAYAERLFRLLHTHCLFSATPACKGARVRGLAFALLLALARSERALHRVALDVLAAQVRSLRVASRFEIEALGVARDEQAYAGLSNLGATCYMNSTLQQLFLIPAFRAAVLAAEDVSGAKPRESVLAQLQLLFARLQDGAARCVDTTRFAGAFMVDGRAVNPRVQMDASEFLSALFDQLEHCLGPEQARPAVQALFRSELVHEIVGQGACPHRRERREPCYAVAVEINEQASLQDALALYVRGEQLTGANQYACDACGAHVDIVKRTLLGSPAPLLFVHLKRFEVDYNSPTLASRKLNAYCAFPRHLSLAPYVHDPSVGGLDYELVGVTVHAGSLDSGHYYAFAKERVALAGGTPAWYEFNDAHVCRYEVARLEDDAFGGVVEVDVLDRVTKEKRVVQRPKNHSAYLLLYQRKGADVLAAPALPHPPHANPDDGIREQGATLQDQSGETPVMRPDKPMNDKHDVTSKRSNGRSRRNNANRGVSSEDAVTHKSNGKHRSKAPVPSDTAETPSTVPPPWEADGAIGLKPDQPNTLVEEMASTFAAHANHSVPSASSFSAARVLLPRTVEEKITSKNRRFVHEVLLFEPNFHAYVWRLLHIDGHANDAPRYSSELHTAQLGVLFVKDVYSHSKRRPFLSMWVAWVARLLSKCDRGSSWLLGHTDERLLLECAFELPNIVLQAALATLLSAALTCALDTESKAIGRAFAGDSSGLKERCHAVSPSLAILDALLALARRKSLRDRVTPQTFAVPVVVARHVEHAAAYYIRSGLKVAFEPALRRAGLFGADKVGASTALSSRSSKAVLSAHALLIAELACRSVSDEAVRAGEAGPDPLPLRSADDEQFLTETVPRLLRRELAFASLARLATHDCRYSRTRTRHWFALLVRGVADAMSADVRVFSRFLHVQLKPQGLVGFMRVLFAILEIDDDDALCDWRYAQSLEHVLACFEAKDRSRQACERMLRLLEAFCARTPAYRAHFARVRKELTEIIKPLELRLVADA